MITTNLFSQEDKKEYITTYRKLLRKLGDTIGRHDILLIKEMLQEAILKEAYGKDIYGLNILLNDLHTAYIVTEEMGLGRSSIIAVFLSNAVMRGVFPVEDIEKRWGSDIAMIIHGLIKTQELYVHHAAIRTENFHKLLLSFAEDLRVILIIIANRLHLLRHIKEIADEEQRQHITAEASYLYAPLSHRLGLYKIKSELEDLSLKYQDRPMYDYIKDKLNETKQSRENYIAEFITPLEKRLKEAGLNFDIKGRTKSIHSIRNKLLKKKVDVENMYDLFAIRIIIDTDPEKEKKECWMVYSIVSDMYQTIPNRLKDWLSVPKTNGYESLHTTVIGPDVRWVEVQIRSKRMDEIAERGFAAHWKYKGIREESGLDEWMNHVRQILESKDIHPTDLMRVFKMNLYDEEIFVFTPGGDLFKLPQNATVLDFAFAIHTELGSKCVSAKINGKNVPIKYRLKSGDQVEILTSPHQSPKQDWLSLVVTSKARIKIKQSLKEEVAKQADIAKELLHRRFKNRKIEEDEAILMRVIKKMGFKTVTLFYADIANERLDVNEVIEQYVELEKREREIADHTENRSVEGYIAPTPVEDVASKEDVLVIDSHLTGIDYRLAKCCNPIYGDDIFGFVSSQGVKIHRTNCPNAPALFNRYGYRTVQARWSGKSGTTYPITLRIIGHDDIGIVTNITSVISKEPGTTLRTIHVDSVDGLFQGNITVLLSDTSVMTALIKKIKMIKGVKQVERLN